MNTNPSGVDPVPPASEHSRYPQPMPVRHRWTQDWNGKVCIGCGAHWDSTLDGAACRGMLYTDSERAFVEAAAKVHDDAAASEKRALLDQELQRTLTEGPGSVMRLNLRPKRSGFVEFEDVWLVAGVRHHQRIMLSARHVTELMDGSTDVLGDAVKVYMIESTRSITVRGTLDEVRAKLEEAL